MKTKKQIPFIWLGPIITLGIMLVLYAAGGIYPFGTVTTAFADGVAQYIPFLSELSDKIQSGSSLLFSWNAGSGANFWTNIAYYLTSPLNLIALFYDAENMDCAFSVITLLKPVIMALTFGIFLKKTYNKNDLSVAIFSTLWAMSSFMVGFSYITSWYDSVIWFPLVIMGLKKMMDGGSAWSYALFLGLAIASNFYFGWMICIFCIIYFVYYLLADDDIKIDNNVQEETTEENADETAINIFEVFKTSYLLKTFFRFGLSSVLAGGISAIMTLPVASVLSETGKGTTEKTLFNVTDVWSVFASHIFPVKNTYSTLLSTDVLFSFVGTISIILVVAFFFTRGISLRKKIGNLFLLVAMWVSVAFYAIAFVWHGFGVPEGMMFRFAFVYSFILIKIAYEAFINIKNISILGVLAGTVFAGFCTACIYISPYMRENSFSAHLVTTVAIFIILFAVLLLIMTKKIKLQNILTVVLLIAVIGESVALNWNNILVRDVNADLSESEVVEQAKEYLEAGDSLSFESKNQVFNDMLMFGRLYNYKTLENYSSMADKKMTLTASDLGSYSNRLNLHSGAQEQTPIFNLLFPTKYYLDGTGRLSESSFRKEIADFNGYKLFENNYTMPFMYTLPVEIAEWDTHAFAVNTDCINDIFCKLGGYEVGEGAAITNKVENFRYDNCYHISFAEKVEEEYKITGEKLPDSYLEYFEQLESRMRGFSYKIKDLSKNASVTFDSIVQTDGIAYIFIDVSTLGFDDLTITHNGRTIKYKAYGVNENRIYEIGEAKKGDVITITVGGYQDGYEGEEILYAVDFGSFSAYTFTIDMKKFEECYNKLDAMSDTELLEFEDTYVKAKVTSYTDGALYIPTTYDEGWKIFIDGQQVGLYEHQSHILMTAITEGEHIVEMKYCPVGFVPGAVITGVSVAILVAWAVIATKRSKKEELCVTINETNVSEE